LYQVTPNFGISSITDAVTTLEPYLWKMVYHTKMLLRWEKLCIGYLTPLYT